MTRKKDLSFRKIKKIYHEPIKAEQPIVEEKIEQLEILPELSPIIEESIKTPIEPIVEIIEGTEPVVNEFLSLFGVKDSVKLVPTSAPPKVHVPASAFVDPTKLDDFLKSIVEEEVILEASKPIEITPVLTEEVPQVPTTFTQQVINLTKPVASKKPKQDPNIKAINDRLGLFEKRLGELAMRPMGQDPGGGETKLRRLDDIDRNSIVDGYVLSYNGITEKFEFIPPITSSASFNPTDVKAVYAEVKNGDSVTIHKGDPVYLYRATGNMASVILAGSSAESTSAKTLGLAYSTFEPGQTGIIVTKGTLTGVDTSMYGEGDTLYVGSTVGTLTNVKPHSPNHLVYIGVVQRANQGQGQIYVSPQNGYELDELHNVNIDYITQLADGHVLQWSVANNQWINAALPAQFSGSYNDLTDKPTSINWTNPDVGPTNNFKTLIVAEDGYASINILDGVPPYLNSSIWKFDKTKITFPDNSIQTTAWTGTYSYNDLTDKPTIPSLSGYATESYVSTAIGNLIGAAPETLNTLKEIADQLATDESIVSSLTTTVAGKVSLTGSYANPTWITSLAYGKLTGAPTNVSSFTNDAGYLTSVSWAQVTNKPANILTLNDTNVVSNDMLVNKSITIGSTAVELGTSITTLTDLTGVTSNAATAFIAGAAAESGVALQMPREGALRNMTNGANTMYFDVSNGGTTHGNFNFRSSSNFTSLLHLSSVKATINPAMEVNAQTPYVGRTPFNSALDTVVTVDNLKYRISNQGGVFPQIASASGSTVDVCYDVLGVVNGNTPAAAQNSGYLLASNGTWLSIYSAHGMDSRGDRVTAHITDKAAGKIYRATFMKTNNNSNTDGYNIIVERII